MLNCFPIPWASMNSDTNVFNSFDLAFALSLMTGAKRWNSLVADIANQYPPIPSDSTLATAKNSYKSMMYWMVKAIKYPIGLFELNGNLFKLRRKTKKFHQFYEPFEQNAIDVFTTLEMAAGTNHFLNQSWNIGQNWQYMMVSWHNLLWLSSCMNEAVHSIVRPDDWFSRRMLSILDTYILDDKMEWSFTTILKMLI